MMQTRKLTEGAVLLAVYAVLLLLTLYTPLIGAIITLFLPMPFILFSARSSGRDCIYFFITAIMLSFIVGTIKGIPYTFLYGVLGIVIGFYSKEGRSRTQMFVVGSIATLVNLVGILAVSIVFFHVNFVTETIELMKIIINDSTNTISSVSSPKIEESIDKLKDAMVTIEKLIPSIFIFLSILMVFVIELISVPIVKRFGIKIGTRKPFREFALHKSILWIFLLTIILSITLNPDKESLWYLVSINIIITLQLLITVQGLAIVYYFTHIKDLPKVIPVILTLLVFSQPIVLSIIRILGIMDLGFDIRKYMLKKK